VGDCAHLPAGEDARLPPRGAVYCLTLDAGRVVWKFDDDGAMQHTSSSPCVADGRLYVGEGMHANLTSRFYCLDASSGRKLWQFQTAGHIESSPCVTALRGFIRPGDGGVAALDAET